MQPRVSVLCPVDFSESSRTSLRYARVVADHCHVPLVAMTVTDPLLYEAATLADPGRVVSDRAALEQFVNDTFGGHIDPSLTLEFVAVVGKPAPEILRVARERRSDLIVMSSHGLGGVRKMFFGSTTERVLRETTVPVVVTPPLAPGPLQLETIRSQTHRVLVPVDMTSATAAQVAAARFIGETLGVPLLLVYVVEPVRGLVSRVHLPRIDAERRSRAERELALLANSLPPRCCTETLVAFGDPAEEIAKVARDRNAGAVVMGLHSSPITGPRMGSVTYRVLCLAHAVVIAIPPVESGAGAPAAFAAPEMLVS